MMFYTMQMESTLSRTSCGVLRAGKGLIEVVACVTVSLWCKLDVEGAT